MHEKISEEEVNEVIDKQLKEENSILVIDAISTGLDIRNNLGNFICNEDNYQVVLRKIIEE